MVQEASGVTVNWKGDYLYTCILVIRIVELLILDINICNRILDSDSRSLVAQSPQGFGALVMAHSGVTTSYLTR